MKQKTIFRLNVIIVFFLFHSFTCPALGSIKKKLTADITLNVNWNIESGDEVNKGSLQFHINGKLNVNKTFSSAQQDLPAVMIPYNFSQANANYSYKETIINTNPPKDCPQKIEAQYSGSGSIPFKPVPQFGDFYVQYLGGIMKTLQEAGVGGFDGSENMVDFYRFHTGGHGFTVKGKRLIGCEYVNHEKKGHVAVKFGSKIGRDGKLSGQSSWSAKFTSGRPIFHAEAYNLPPKMSQKPFTPPESPGGNAHYSLYWNIGEQKAPYIELKNVSFNYENNSEQIVMTLRKLDDLSPINSPEWIKDEKNEPAAFVLGKPFKVKAVFENEDPDTNKLEIWAEEEVEEGDGGFGGIKKKTFNIRKGEFSADFEIEKPQKTIGINKVTWTWFGKDKTQDKEEVVNYLGESRHTIYIVGGDPGGNILKTEPYFNTIVYIVRKGCEWAKGTKGGKQTFDRIWSNFKNIPGPNNQTLIYSHAEKHYSTPELLRSNRGACGAWSEFFYDTTACQGIRVERIAIHPDEPYNILVVDKRLKGQGNPSPDIAFTEHSLNAYQGEFYDPSYHFKMTKNYHAYENRIVVVYCSSEKVALEEYLKKLMFGDLVNFCSEHWKQYVEGKVPNAKGFAECISDENSNCVPNDPQLCEIIECSDRNYPPNTP